MYFYNVFAIFKDLIDVKYLLGFFVQELNFDFKLMFLSSIMSHAFSGYRSFPRSRENLHVSIIQSLQAVRFR